MKRIIALVALFILVVSASGCLEKNMCKDIEKEMAGKNITCHCVNTNVIPKEYENVSAEPKCTCLCYSKGVWINTTIAVSDNKTG